MLVGFGPFIAGQIWNCIQSGRTEISNGGMIGFTAAELVLLAVVLWVGKIRGWSLATMGFKCSWNGTVAGVFLFVVAEVAMIGVGMLVKLIHPAQPRFGAHQLAVSFVLLLSFINPVYEEGLQAGYFIHALQRFGMWPVVLASALFRAFYHLQFGINTALSLFAFGLIFGFAYWRWRQLWPLIVAHSLCDIVGLLYASYHHPA